MNKTKWIFIVTFILLVLLLPARIGAQQTCESDSCEKIGDPNSRVSCYSALVAACQNQRETLSGQINYMTNQIRLTTSRIESTKRTIDTLLHEINQLED